MMHQLTVITAIAGLAIAGPATIAQAGGCAAHSHPTSAKAAPAGKDIVDTAVAAGSFKTLAAALDAADLVQALKGDGPFTVFAPTDAAFAQLPAGTLENLLKPENKKTLQDILTYHVVPGKVLAADVAKVSEAKALNQDALVFAITDGQAQVNGVKIVKTDIICDNGVIHVIDAVLIPDNDPADEARSTQTHAISATL